MHAYRRVAVSRRVVVNTKTGTSLAGVLVAERGPILILKGAAMLTATANPVPVDGDVVIERSNVDFVQVLPAEG